MNKSDIHLEIIESKKCQEKMFNMEDDLTKMLEKLMKEDTDDIVTTSSQSTSLFADGDEEESSPSVFGDWGKYNMDKTFIRGERSIPFTTKERSKVAEKVKRVEKKYKTSSSLYHGISLGDFESSLNRQGSYERNINNNIGYMTSTNSIIAMRSSPNMNMSQSYLQMIPKQSMMQRPLQMQNINNFNTFNMTNQGMSSFSQNAHLNQNMNFSLNTLNPLKPEENFPNFISPNFYQSFKGKFSYLVQNYNGSRLLQQSLANTDESIISLIFEEIKHEIPSLISHQYGNYFCQRFYSLLPLHQRVDFLRCIQKEFLQISANNIGNYPLQTIIECLNSEEEQAMIIESIRRDHMIQNMLKDGNAVHVLEKIITRFKEEKIKFLYNFILENFVNLSISQNGLGLVKKMIIHSSSFATKKKIQKIISDNFIFLIQNIYGNYTIQMAIEYWDNSLLTPILKLFINKFAKLSMLKYSSNVVEKCLEKGGETLVNIFIEEIISNNKIPSLIRNNYGNYVIQKALMIASPNFRILLINNILQQLGNVEDKKIIVKWKHICDSNISLLINSSQVNGFGNESNILNLCNFNNFGNGV